MPAASICAVRRQSGERAAQHLAALTEPGADEPEEPLRVDVAAHRRRLAADDADQGRLTFGLGRNTVAGTVPTTSAVAQYATFTDTAPYASSPGPGARRSPTSRCTITSIRSI